MTRRTSVVALAALVVGVLAVGAGIGIAASSDDDDQPITAPARERAVAAALAHVGEGRATDTEAGDEEGAYEVEVTLEHGDQVDVHLDERFRVIGTEPDLDRPDDDTDDDTG